MRVMLFASLALLAHGVFAERLSHKHLLDIGQFGYFVCDHCRPRGRRTSFLPCSGLPLSRFPFVYAPRDVLAFQGRTWVGLSVHPLTDGAFWGESPPLRPRYTQLLALCRYGCVHGLAMALRRASCSSRVV